MLGGNKKFFYSSCVCYGMGCHKCRQISGTYFDWPDMLLTQTVKSKILKNSFIHSEYTSHVIRIPRYNKNSVLQLQIYYDISVHQFNIKRSQLRCGAHKTETYNHTQAYIILILNATMEGKNFKFKKKCSHMNLGSRRYLNVFVLFPINKSMRRTK